MTVNEKVAYLKGLAEGLSLDADSKEGKLFTAIIDTLGDIADDIEELFDNVEELGEGLDSVSEDLEDVEDFLLEDGFDDDDDDYDFDFDDDEDDEDDEFNCRHCGAPISIDVNCPECGAELVLDEVDIENESVTCPACNRLIELEIDEVDFDDDDDDEEFEEEEKGS